MASIVDDLISESIEVHPVRYKLLGGRIRLDGKPLPEGAGEDAPADGLIELSWSGNTARFTYQIRSSSTPKAVETAKLQAKSKASAAAPPLVIVPYLAPEQMRKLEADGVSGFDLSGNVLVTGGGLYIWNGGHPNLFPESRPIKNIYRGRGSIFARSFLLKRDFPSLSDLREFALRRLEPKSILGEIACFDESTEQKLTLSTASKVVSTLVEDNLVERNKNGLWLFDNNGLLANLKAQFEKPKAPSFQGRTTLSPTECWNRLGKEILESPYRACTTGLGTAGHYGVISTENRQALRVSSIAKTVDLLEITPTSAFPNIELSEDSEEIGYFDCRQSDGMLWASPIQTLLELSAGGPRERDTALRFEARLLELAMEGRK